MKMQELHFVFLAICITLLIGCRSQRVEANLPERSISEVVEGLKDSRIEFDFFSSKAKIKLNGEDARFGGRSNIRMIRDEIIWMNFKKIGVEGARTLIRPDSTWILYRQEDLFESGETKDLLANLDIYRSFGEIQDLMIGNMPIPEEGEILDFKIDGHYKLSFQKGKDHYQYLINEDYSIFRALIRDGFDRVTLATYTEYDEISKISTKKEFEITTPGQGKSIFTIKLSNVEFDIPKEIKFEIPDHYSRAN